MARPRLSLSAAVRLRRAVRVPTADVGCDAGVRAVHTTAFMVLPAWVALFLFCARVRLP